MTTLALLAGIVIAGRIALLQLACLAHPIFAGEGHSWRQSFTYGVAWNFAHTTHDFFKPRMFPELVKNNIIAMEAPIYPYLGGALISLFGDGVGPLRVVSWLSLVVIVVVVFVWLGQGRATRKEAWCDRAGFLIALGVSPAVAVEFRSVQPDPMAAGLAAAAAFFLSRYASRERRRDLAIGAFLASLAVLTKPVVLGVIPSLALLGIYGKGWPRRVLQVALALALALAPHVLWDRWAHHLLSDEMGGLVVISIDHNPTLMLQNLTNASYIREAVLHFIPDYAGSWWLVPSMLAGVYRGLADARLRRLGLAMLLWMLVYTIELLAFGDRLHSNAYYFVLAPMPVLLFSAFGIGALVQALDSATKRMTPVASRAALVTLLLPVGLVFSSKVDWSIVDHPGLALELNRAVWTSDLRLALLLFALAIAFGLSTNVRARRVPLWVGLPVLSGVLISAFWASQDAAQYFRYYEASRTRGPFSGELKEMRHAINLHSTPDDRVIFDPSDMVFFSYAARNGFAATEAKSAEQVSRLRSRGARLYLQNIQAGATSSVVPHGRLLESSPRFNLYCVAADDCL